MVKKLLNVLAPGDNDITTLSEYQLIIGGGRLGGIFCVLNMTIVRVCIAIQTKTSNILGRYSI